MRTASKLGMVLILPLIKRVLIPKRGMGASGIHDLRTAMIWVEQAVDQSQRVRERSFGL